MTEADLQTFAQGIQTLAVETRRQLGEPDVRFLKRLMGISRAVEIVSRLLLQFGSGIWAWLVGMVGLALHLAMDGQFMHSIQHGAYIGLPGAEKFTPERFETLAVPLQTQTWGKAHAIHHRSPSLVGIDPDTLHPFYRVHPSLRWRPWHRLNVFLGPLVTFESCAIYYDRLLKKVGQRAPGDRSELYKFLGFVAYQYVFFPWIAGPRWKVVLAANVSAVIFRNFVVSSLQMGSSVGPGVSHRHDRAFGSKSAGDWCKFQVETSKNYRLEPGFWGQKIWKSMLGGLDRHIEHHLYPNLPPNRLHELSGPVRELCEKHGVVYEEHASIGASLVDSLSYLHTLSKPGHPA